jgi:hypothetical protein
LGAAQRRFTAISPPFHHRRADTRCQSAEWPGIGAKPRRYNGPHMNRCFAARPARLERHPTVDYAF